MSKKAGILTFHNALSYGAVLQSYALQNFMLINGLDNEIVDYQCDYMNKNYKSLFHTVKGKRLKSFVGCLLKLKNKKKSLALSESFRKRFLITSKSYTRSQMSEVANKYDIFVSGSDQVWSPTCVGFDKTYFLDFARPEQKYSYAASMGTSVLPAEYHDEYRALLSEYKTLSVRESSSVDIIDSLIGRKARTDVDPTLLLTADEWDKITCEVEPKKPYIFLFNVLKPKRMIEYAVKLGKEKNMPVYYLNDKHLPISGIKYIEPVSADMFISLIKNAEYVVTNSFHASAFSIIFHKKLAMELDTETKRNTRSEELLNLLGIGNIEIKAKSDPDPDLPIDWEKADRIIDTYRKQASDYIKEIKDSIV